MSQFIRTHRSLCPFMAVERNYAFAEEDNSFVALTGLCCKAIVGHYATHNVSYITFTIRSHT